MMHHLFNYIHESCGTSSVKNYHRGGKFVACSVLKLYYICYHIFFTPGGLKFFIECTRQKETEILTRSQRPITAAQFLSHV